MSNGLSLLILTLSPARGAMVLTDVPDYQWHAGCFGTACGNLMGYWDRHGLPDRIVGESGIERFQNDLLRGKSGMKMPAVGDEDEENAE